MQESSSLRFCIFFQISEPSETFNIQKRSLDKGRPCSPSVDEEHNAPGKQQDLYCQHQQHQIVDLCKVISLIRKICNLEPSPLQSQKV